MPRAHNKWRTYLLFIGISRTLPGKLTGYLPGGGKPTPGGRARAEARRRLALGEPPITDVGSHPRAQRCRVGAVGWIALVTERINRSKSKATSQTAISCCARLSGTRERQSVMLTTLLVIVSSIAAGIIVSHVHPEYRKR